MYFDHCIAKVGPFLSLTFAGLILVSAVATVPTAATAAVLSDDLENSVDSLLSKAASDGRFAGLSVVIIDSSGTSWTHHYGFSDVESKTPPNDHTIYELGSITKTFTRLLLAAHPDMKLSDPISIYLPAGVTDPKPDNQEIHLQDLALHVGLRIGAPCILVGPDSNLDNASLKCFGFDNDPNTADPWKDVTEKNLLEYVGTSNPMFAQYPQYFVAPGRFYAYSNTGMALLGDLIGWHYGTSYASLLRREILRPLRMRETYLEMPCEVHSSCVNLAKVYRNSADGRSWVPGSLWHLSPGIPAAGALRSSIFDMAKYLKLELGLLKNPLLTRAVAVSQTELPDAEAELKLNLCVVGDPLWKPCNKSVSPQFEGWPSDVGKKVFYHAGETGASQSMILISQDRTIGMVLLSNSVPGTGPSETEPHLPNDLSLCIAQMAGIYPAAAKLCDKFN